MSSFVDPTQLVRRHRAQTPKHAAPTPVDVVALASALRRTVEGEVRFDAGSRALYSTDASNYRQVPIGVVVPRSIDDVVATLAACRAHSAPVLSRGGGTSLAGQCCNVAVVIDWTKHLHRVLEVDPGARLARVQPGAVLDDLRAAAEVHHLTFGPDPATHDRCTLGGMIGNNSCGVHSVMAGRTADNVHALDVLTYDGLQLRVGPTTEDELARIIAEGGRRGEIYRRLRALRDRYAALIRARYPKIPRRVSGYNLDELLPENGFHVARALVGTEGTCVTVLEATLRLIHSPPVRSLLVLGYPDAYAAADDVPAILAHGPTGCEGFDRALVEGMKKKGLHPRDVDLLPPGGGWLVVEFGGESRSEADGRARGLMDELRQRQGHAPSMKLFDDKSEEAEVWAIRESGLGATARIPGEPDASPGWEDAAVPPERMGDYLRDFRTLLDRYGYHAALYGHFGQGCVHCRIDFDLRTREGIDRYRAFVGDAADLVISYGGSLSGEHGDGQSRAELLPRMFGPELVEAFREFKSIWDPDGRMNPGKVVAPHGITDDLRLGTGYSPPEVHTHFGFADDGGSFAHATNRCVGVGRCRREDGGTMCPSYMVTREEAHSTRGRAHLLFEMLQGDPLAHGWQSEHVKDALDLCLACKGCKSECPVNVDMATYKAEFLSHYYSRSRRPRHAYAFGLIDVWARLASLVPELANFVTQTPGLRSLARAAAGIANERTIPRFARRTFKDWFRTHAPRNPEGREVLLWPDTFNNYLHPETAVAAVEVLEALGFRVTVPTQSLCCGRPLYDYGMLDRATKYLHRTLDALRPSLRAGVPVVGLEPSCTAVFRDELTGLLRHDEDAHRLATQTYLFSEFLEKYAPDAPLPQLSRRAVVHGHCHHKSLMKLTDEEAVLRRIGADHRVLDAGCCGMAGAFGFEKEHYDVSVACGERVLLPAVRDAGADELVVADGFSCREQIAQRTGRRALHLAQVVQLALRGDDVAGAAPREYPERAIAPLPPRPSAVVARVVGVGVVAAAVVVLARAVGRRVGPRRRSAMPRRRLR